jgi:flagellar motor protein MotB
MVTRVLSLASAALLVLALGTGCSNNKSNAERESLMAQNKQLSDQLNDMKGRLDNAEARANANATTAVTPAPDFTGVSVPPMDENPTAGTGNAGPSTLDNGVETSVNKFGQNVIRISGDVLFDSGKATLKPSAKKSLDKVATLIKQKYSGQTLRIEGHTDPNPIKSTAWDDNWDLGHARARAVLLYLSSKGVNKKNMFSASFADTQLRSTKNYALNRRVDIVVTGGK